MIGIEPEIAVQVAENMSGNELWTPERVATFIDSVIPAVEIVESRFSTWPLMGILAAIADNGVHRQLILGEPILGWDRESIEAAEVSLKADGNEVRRGRSSNVDSGPFSVLAWLANHLNQKGRHLRSGDVVTTGVMTDIYDGTAGQHILADYGPLGIIQIEIV
jgi:2-keto-4-pentenoate hydratase